jgi:hypothetical protein
MSRELRLWDTRHGRAPGGSPLLAFAEGEGGGFFGSFERDEHAAGREASPVGYGDRLLGARRFVSHATASF